MTIDQVRIGLGRQVDTRPNQALVIQNADVFVDRNRILYATDTNGGLYILELDLPLD